MWYIPFIICGTYHFFRGGCKNKKPQTEKGYTHMWRTCLPEVISAMYRPTIPWQSNGIITQVLIKDALRFNEKLLWVIPFISEMLKAPIGDSGLFLSIHIRNARGHPGDSLGYSFCVRNARGHLGDILGFSFMSK